MSQELKPTTKGDENVETAEMFLARVGYSDSRVHSSVAIAILMEDYSRAKLERTTAALLGTLKNCRNGLDLLLQGHRPRCATDPFDTINELRETVRKCSAAIAEAETTGGKND